MSKLLRLPLVLLIALAMTLMWTWPATGDEPLEPSAGECLVNPAPEECPPPGEPALEGGTDDVPTDGGTGGGAGTEPGAAAGGDTKSQTPAGQGTQPSAGRPYSYGGWAGSAATGLTGESSPLTEGEATTAEAEEGDEEEADEGEEEPAGEPDPAAVGACLAALVEDLLGHLQTLGADGEDPAGAIEAALPGLDPTDPTSISDFLTDLGVAPGNLAAGEALITKALEDAAECLTATGPPEEETPTGGGSNNPPAGGGFVGGQETYYENCDDARAKGAAPVYAGQPGYRAGLDSDGDGIGCEDDGPAVTPVSIGTTTSGTLAYTGVDLEPMLRIAAILISSGTLLLLGGRRQA